MSTELQRQIVQYCKQINQRCQIEYENFNFNELKKRNWYLAILEIIFPHLDQKIQIIKKINNQVKAINTIIVEINDLDQFQQLEIDGTKIVAGDQNQIQNMVQIIQALCQIATQEYEEAQIEDQEQFKQYQKNAVNHFNENNNRQKKTISDYDKPKSVQAIFNQFEKQSDDQNEQFDSKDQMFIDQQQFETKKPMVQTIAPKYKREEFNEPYKKFPNQKQSSQDISDENRILKQKMVDNKNIKQKKKKNPQKNMISLVKSSHKKLVTHPKSPQTLKKAKSTDEIALTNQIKQDIKKTKKKQKNIKTQVLRPVSPMQQQINIKNNQLQYFSNAHNKQKNQRQITKQNKKDYSQKNQQNLYKLLNFRQQQIKKQQKQYKQSIKLKIRNQKQQYIKKINNLILELQRQKKIQQKNDFKQQLVKQNEEAVKKLTSLEQWYKNKLNLLKQNRKIKNNQRLLIKTGHKQIIKRIEKQLKKQNQQKLLQLTNMYRVQQDNIQTDYEELKNKIIKVYKRN